ncbi:MAG: dTDP-4-amino-4,6-dideoxygalactose transaminase [Gammaproteobacteria bacterium]|nr:dTDP-4-amino-4,6-dideoxygalactose transaminase [Gammaproteobacteria bacterium]
MSIPFHVPTITGSESERVAAACRDPSVLQSDGPFSELCADLLRAYLEAENVLFTPSCTAALEIAAMLTVGPGDEVIVPSFTFVTSVSCFTNLGAKPVFCDIREDTLNIDESKISDLVTSRTKAIVAVHYGGISCEMDEIKRIAKDRDIAVVEDAAQALSGSYKNRALGSIGDVACFSFHSTKNYHCGEGGALVIDKPELLARAEIHREKGTNRRAFIRGQIDKYTWVDRGSSYVPSELNMAFLSCQLEHIESVKRKRKSLFDRYVNKLQTLEDAGSIRLPIIPQDCRPSYHLFYMLLQDSASRDKLLEHLQNKGIGATFHYVPLHTSPVGSKLHDGRPLHVTERIHNRLLRLPLYPNLRNEDIDLICREVYDFFGQVP